MHTGMGMSTVVATTQMDLIDCVHDVSEVRLDFTEQADEYVLNAGVRM